MRRMGWGGDFFQGSSYAEASEDMERRSGRRGGKNVKMRFSIRLNKLEPMVLQSGNSVVIMLSRNFSYFMVLLGIVVVLAVLNSSRLKRFLAISLDNSSIEFYGIVLDEKGKPLPNSEVSWDVIKSGSFAPGSGLSTGSRGVVKTGSDGRFIIKNETGVTLGIRSVTRDGYHQTKRNGNAFSYGDNAEPHKPDYSAPERFIMIKNGTPKSFKAEVPLKFDWDGVPKEIKIDVNGREETIIINPELTAVDPNPTQHHWKVSIRLKDAELAKGKIGDACIAPETGYVPEISLERDIDEQWGLEANALLYVKTKDGFFGEIYFSAYSNRNAKSNTGSMMIRWNKEGGRAFE